MMTNKNKVRKLQTDHLRFLGARDVEFMESGNEVIVIATFGRRFIFQPYDIDAIARIIGIRPDIGYDNSGTDAKTVDMVYSYPATRERGNVI